jgi:ABC-type sugar transport system, periplasmic component
LVPEFGDVKNAFNAKAVEFKYSKEFKDYVDLQNKYSVQPTVSLDYSMQVEQLFAMDKVAMIQQGNWIYPALEDIDEDFAQNKVGMIPIPVEGIEENNLPVGVPYYWGVNANKEKEVQDAAIKFLDWMYTSEQGKNIVIEKFKFAPAYSGFDTSKISDPLTKTVYDYLSNDKTTNWVFMGYPTDWAMDQLGAQIQKYLAGEASWDNIINDCRTKWENARK